MTSFPVSFSFAFPTNNLKVSSTLAVRCKNDIVCCQNAYHETSISHVSTRPARTIHSVATASNYSATTTTAASTATTTTTTVQTPLKGAQEDGIGIIEFLQGKNYFITGATGFLAKVFIEKMLRTVADVGKIFLLIKANDQEAAMDRLQTEIIDSELFKCLKEKYGRSYKTFMMSKLIPVVGDVTKSNLGIDVNMAHEMATQIHVIVNSAANTTFDERYDVALDTNTRGPVRLLHFAKCCNNLCVFMHVSTAYVNGERKGIIPEKPFSMGDSIAGETSAEIIPALDVDSEQKLASDIVKSLPENQVVQKMKELGLERANMFGWQCVYPFTKAMGEMMINSMRGEIPVVIIRPTIVESTYKQPFPGWIQGNRMLDPLIISYGKGQLPGFVGDPKAVMDVIPADMVVNATMAAIAKHGKMRRPELNVYHVASSVANPILLEDVFKFTYDHFTDSPLMNSKGKNVGLSGMKFFNSFDAFSSYITVEIACQSGLTDANTSDPKLLRRLELKCKKKAEHVIHMAKMYMPYMLYQGRFDNGNTRKLIKEMSVNEARDFGFDVGNVCWEKYIADIHLPGVKTHVMMGRLIC